MSYRLIFTWVHLSMSVPMGLEQCRSMADDTIVCLWSRLSSECGKNHWPLGNEFEGSKILALDKSTILHLLFFPDPDGCVRVSL